MEKGWYLITVYFFWYDLLSNVIFTSICFVYILKVKFNSNSKIEMNDFVCFSGLRSQRLETELHTLISERILSCLLYHVCHNSVSTCASWAVFCSSCFFLLHNYPHVPHLFCLSLLLDYPDVPYLLFSHLTDCTDMSPCVSVYWNPVKIPVPCSPVFYVLYSSL